MNRLALALTFLAAPAFAQDMTTDLPDMADAADVPNLDCEQTGEDVSCTFDALAPYDFCMAVDAEGEPLANAMGSTDAGVVLFQGIDAQQIASLRCRDI
ncbi:hypothetical protein JSE7799_03009 [Jannaschia seosinensis]|uniref:Integral membrane protein n=1 Tax=Jannaschia seosinensis TaxID=313367 RepID=A0A0M7BBW4_9RHOB|nr:hypothetical protein [Jannaschia seosinensis]CUH40277.1 hypothetical protein JSE7799_03009 [Jannaschia seosinensis]